MKTAVLLAGFPRNYQQTFKFFEKFLLAPLNADVFFCGYHNIPDKPEDEFLSLYKPKRYFFQNWTAGLRSKIFEAYGGDLFIDTHPATVPEKILSQYFNLYYANELKREFERENNFVYDLVIRSRPDVFFFQEIEPHLIEEALKGGVVIPDTWDFSQVHELATTDSFAMSTSANIDTYCNFFNCMKQYNQEEGILFHPETLLGYHLKKNNLRRIKCDWFYTFHQYDESGALPVGEIVGDPNVRHRFSNESA